MALTRDDSRSWIPDSTRGGYFPVLEIWNPSSWIPSAPDGGRDVGFTVQVEILHKDSRLESKDAIQDALNQASGAVTAEALEPFDTDGRPLTVADTKRTSKGRLPKNRPDPRRRRHLPQACL